MKTINLIALIAIALLAVGCSAAVQPSFDADVSDAASDGSDVDGNVDGGVGPDVDAGDASDVDSDVDADAGDVDAGDAGPDVCTSLADGCAGMFAFPSNDGSDTVETATPPYFGAVGDYRESPPTVLPDVLIARHLDLTDLYVVPAGGMFPCGPMPEFRVLVNGVEVGRFTPPSGTDVAEHFDFAPIAGTVFTVRIEETTAYCSSTLRVVAGSRWGAFAALGAP